MKTLITFHLDDDSLRTEGSESLRTVQVRNVPASAPTFVTLEIEGVAIIANTDGIETLRIFAAAANEALASLEAIVAAKSEAEVSDSTLFMEVECVENVAVGEPAGCDFFGDLTVDVFGYEIRWTCPECGVKHNDYNDGVTS